jgi:hypothetical protein
MLPKRALLKGGHVGLNTVSRRPTETALRQLNRPVLAGPFIDAAKPVAVHPTDHVRREPGLRSDAVQPDRLRPQKRLVFGPVHVALAAQSEPIPKDPAS